MESTDCCSHGTFQMLLGDEVTWGPGDFPFLQEPEVRSEHPGSVASFAPGPPCQHPRPLALFSVQHLPGRAPT